MTFWKWSRVAGSNGNADTSVNYLEGQAPSTLNDAGRAVMAAAAKYRDDMAGAIVTGGSVNAYTVFSYQGFDSLAHLDGNVIAFSPHVTSTGACQISIDGLGLKPLRPSPGVDFIGGELIQGTPYTALYNNSNGEAYVRGLTSSPYAVPFLCGIELWDTIAPNSAFIIPLGQAISRTTYARAFARWGTKYGAGDGSTTFNVPNPAGRVRAMIESAQSLLTPTWFGGDSTQIGAIGGGEKNALANMNQIPRFTPTGTVNVTFGPQGTGGDPRPYFAYTDFGPLGLGGSSNGGVIRPAAISAAFVGDALGSATPSSFKTVQPTITCNYAIRII